MSRRHSATKREILPDVRYGDVLLARFVNHLMYAGKKSVAERIVYTALDFVAEKTKRPPLDIFHAAMENIRPGVEVRSRRVGGATYQIPIEVRSSRAETLAMRWLIKSARSRNEDRMSDRLAREFLDAADGRGGAVKKREDTHKMAEANRTYAHYRW